MLLYELKLSNEEVTRHISRLYSWYEGGTGHDFNQSLLAALTFAHRILPYKPYSGDLFRAQKMPVHAESGETLVMKSGAQPITSWTTTENKAEEFKEDFIKRNDRAGFHLTKIVKLISTEKELCNLPWIKSVAKTLRKDYPKNQDVSNFMMLLNQEYIKDEDEVIVMLSGQYTVKVC